MSFFSPDVVKDIQASQAKWGCPSSISGAQAIQESGGGRYIPPGSNNWLGIQALPGLPSVSAESFEYRNGVRYPATEHFAAFASVAQCFDKHGELIATSRAYRYAMACLPLAGGIPTQDQVNAFAANLAHVYATAPTYLSGLLSIMKSEGLCALDVAGPAWSTIPGVSAAVPVSLDSTDIKTIQEKLNAAGANPRVVVDGVDGPETEKAIMQFQAAKHLIVDGILGPDTLKALESP